MRIEVVLLPQYLTPPQVAGRCVVVFDVLRATTTMAAALHAGVSQIRVFDSPAGAREAAENFPNPRVLCGEINALAPPGFDLGNSPGDFRADLHAGKTVFMSTTNGTRAVVAAREAAKLFVGALVNAQAVARAAVSTNLDITLLCAGTKGAVALEDMLGAGAVVDAIAQIVGGNIVCDDAAMLALLSFRETRKALPAVLRTGIGGHNVIHAGLEPDIDFCAQLNRLNLAGQVLDFPLRVERCREA